MMGGTGAKRDQHVAAPGNVLGKGALKERRQRSRVRQHDKCESRWIKIGGLLSRHGLQQKRALLGCLEGGAKVSCRTGVARAMHEQDPLWICATNCEHARIIGGESVTAVYSHFAAIEAASHIEWSKGEGSPPASRPVDLLRRDCLSVDQERDVLGRCRGGETRDHRTNPRTFWILGIGQLSRCVLALDRPVRYRASLRDRMQHER